MADFEQIVNDFDISNPSETETSETTDTEGEDFLTQAAIEDRVAELFTPKETSKEQPAAEKKPGSEAAKDDKESTTVKDEKQTEVKEVPFLEASQKAFLDESGAIDSKRISDIFGKPQVFANIPMTFEPVEKTETGPAEFDPEKEYADNVRSIIDTLPDILEKEKERYTPEQTIQRLINTFEQFREKRDAKSALMKDLQGTISQFKGEIEESKNTKLLGKIAKNTADLSSNLEGLIPGMNGVDVLNKFLLEKEYGGRYVDWLFRRENRDFDKMPEDQKGEFTEKWFKEFQGNKHDMAMVAEVGRAMWLIQRLPEIIQHAQIVGSQKGKDEAASKNDKPSKILNNQPGTPSKLSEFLGYDSVN